MKIEKINENQIRCTLTREDLDSHQIRLTELAYGTEKAKNLFRDMMEQANQECGFEADNMPLMIEAVPVSAESIVLIITKVEDPEELDTRFSRFAPHHVSEESPVQFDGADNIIDIFQKIYESRVKNGTKKPEASTDKDQPKADPGEINLIYLYRFQQLDDVIQASHGLNNYYTGVNSLYKDRHHKDYRLVVHQSSYSPEEFNKVCNILSEYGTGKAFSLSGEAYLQEHGELIIPSKALQTLFSL